MSQFAGKTNSAAIVLAAGLTTGAGAQDAVKIGVIHRRISSIGKLCRQWREVCRR
jgi:hypothetical protein